MTRRKVLGRGLNALIPQTGAEGDRSGPLQVDIERIKPNPHQPRQQFDQTKLAELAASIGEHGLIQPLVLTQMEDGLHYQIIAGERRWRASKLAGLTQVPAFIKETTPQQMLELALVENIQRADLNPLEEAQAYAQLMEEFGLTQTVLAKRVGKSRTDVANTLRLLSLSSELQAALLNEEITEGHARALLGLKDKPGAQRNALKTVLERQLTVRQTEALVRQLSQGIDQEKPRKVSLSPHEKDMLQRFERKLKTKVEMIRSEAGGAGRITIHFYSDEELQVLFDTILGDESIT